MTINKVKITDGRLRIEYEEASKVRPDSVNEFVLVCSEDPRPSFHKAMIELLPHAMQLLELASYDSGCKVSGLSLSYSKSGVMGAVVTIQKALKGANSPLVLNTPHCPAAPYSETGDWTTCLTSQFVTAIEDVCVEAEAYVKGARDQKVMDLAKAA